MSQTWYYQLLMEEFGPVDNSTIRELLSSETLSQGDLVRASDSSDWVMISSIDAFSSSEAAELAEISDLSELAFSFEDTSPVRVRTAVASKTSAMNQRVLPEKASIASSANTPQVHTVDSPDVYYYQSAGKTFGPIAVVELIGMAEAGLLSATDLVRRGHSGAWTEGSGIKELSGILKKSQQSFAEQLKVAESLKPSKPTNRDSARQESGAEKKKSRTPKPKPVEDKFLKEIFEEISVNKSKASQPSATTSASQPVVSGGASLMAQQTPSPQPSSAPVPPQMSAAAPYVAPSMNSTPRPEFRPPISKASKSKSKASSGLAFEGPLKNVVMAMLVLVVAGGIWFAVGRSAGASIVGSYSPQVKAAMDKYKALGTKPSPAEWNAFSTAVRTQFLDLYKDAVTKGFSDKGSVACVECMKELVRLASTTPNEAEKRKAISEVIEKKMSEMSAT